MGCSCGVHAKSTQSGLIQLSQETPVLAYWGIVGRGDQCRILLHHLGVKFEDKMYNPGDVSAAGWLNQKQKLGMVFPNLPYFIEGETIHSETLPILRSICRKYSPQYLGRNQKEQAYADSFANTIYGDFGQWLEAAFFAPDYKAKKAKHIVSAFLICETVEKQLGRKKFIAGKVTYCDFIVYWAIKYFNRFDASIIKSFPKIGTYVLNMHSLKGVSAAEAKYDKLPLLPPFAAWMKDDPPGTEATPAKPNALLAAAEPYWSVYTDSIFNTIDYKIDNLVKLDSTNSSIYNLKDIKSVNRVKYEGNTQIFQSEDNKSDNLIMFEDITSSTSTILEGQPIHVGILLLKTPSGELVPGNFKVYRTILVHIDSNDPTKTTKTSIKWKRLQPFVDEYKETERFGFKMYGYQKSDEFYVENSDELENWLNILGPLMINEHLYDDYEIAKVLGEGLTAKVYKMHCLVDGKYYAVKTIEKAGLQNSLELDALVHEIDTLRDLRHESILWLHWVYEDERWIHLVTQLASGEELFARVLRRKRFSEYYASMVILNLLSALAYLHSKSIVHRDIKLENILMVDEESDGEILLIDFGLCCEVDGAMLTQQSGSPGYMAPEIIAGLHYGVKVDIFGAGIILYILLTGTPPYPGNTSEEVMIKNMEGTIQYPEEYWKKVSPEAVDLVLLMTIEDPSQRPSADVLLSHPWFKIHHPERAPRVLDVAKNQRQRMLKPGPSAERKTLNKMNKSKIYPSLPANEFKKALEEADTNPSITNTKARMAASQSLNAAENDSIAEKQYD